MFSAVPGLAILSHAAYVADVHPNSPTCVRFAATGAWTPRQFSPPPAPRVRSPWSLPLSPRKATATRLANPQLTERQVRQVPFSRLRTTTRWSRSSNTELRRCPQSLMVYGRWAQVNAEPRSLRLLLQHRAVNNTDHTATVTHTLPLRTHFVFCTLLVFYVVCIASTLLAWTLMITLYCYFNPSPLPIRREPAILSRLLSSYLHDVHQ